YLRLVGSQSPPVAMGGLPASRGLPVTHGLEFANRRHFFAAAAKAMRRILIERARQRSSLKRGGGRHQIPLGELARIADSPDGLLAVDDALERFEAEEPQKAELVKLRFFAGMTMPAAATALGISLATAERWWTFSKAWLYAALADVQ